LRFNTEHWWIIFNLQLQPLSMSIALNEILRQCSTLTADFNVESICDAMTRCQTNNGVDSGAKVCDKYVSSAGLYCKGCRERMMATGTWTEALAKHQSELKAIVAERWRAYRAGLSMEQKEDHRARHRELHDAFSLLATAIPSMLPIESVRANMKLDPVKYEAFRQKDNERRRKHAVSKLKAERERKRARARAGDDDDDDYEKSADKQSASAIPRDNNNVISDDEDEHAVEVADDSSGSDVEGIEFVSSDDEQQ
jgi:hypothetical protein